MWVVVKFVDDVSAVLLSWIRTDDKTGETMCFWPRTNAEKLRAKPNQPIKETDGAYYPCRILMGGAKFDTLQKAIEMEIRAQYHSSAETTDEGENNKRKRVPKKNFSPVKKVSTKKKPKPVPKPVSSSDDTCSDSSNDSGPDTSETDKYTFKKLKTIKMQDCYLPPTVAKRVPDSTNAKSITVLDVVTISPPGEFFMTNAGHTNCDSSGPPQIDTLRAADGKDVECFKLSDIGFKEFNSESFSEAAVGDIIEFPIEIAPQGGQSGEESTLVELIFKQISHLNTKLDALNNKLDTVQTKLDSVSSQVEGYKTVIVDLTAKIMRLEDRFETKNTQPFTLSNELSVPMGNPEAFALNEAALSAKATTAENLVSHICSVNFQSDLEPFIKQVFLTLFDMGFFYRKIIWSRETDKICIKETQVMQCIVRSVKGRFPGLQMNGAQLGGAIYTAAKKLKDSYRKKKDNDN